MYRRSTQWTAEEDAELSSLKNSGMSDQRISVRLRRTTRAIAVRLALLRKRPMQLQSEPTERDLASLSADRSYRAIEREPLFIIGLDRRLRFLKRWLGTVEPQALPVAVQVEVPVPVTL